MNCTVHFDEMNCTVLLEGITNQAIVFTAATMELDKECVRATTVDKENNSNEKSQLETCKDEKMLAEASDIVEKKHQGLLDKLKEQIKTTEEEFENKCKILEDKLNEEGKKKEEIEYKYKSLVNKLRERTECPVCLEVPKTGPVSSCPNGHLVCAKCVGVACPTCRSKMLDGKSLLAVTVLENIEHKCHSKGCEKEFPLKEAEAHKKACDFRLVICPATLCNQKIAFCSVIDHLKDCMHSATKQYGVNKMKNSTKQYGVNKMKNRTTPKKVCFLHNSDLCRPYKVETYLWNERYFFVNINKGSCWTFHVEMLGSEEECSNYGFQLILHRSADPEANGPYVYRLFGKPRPVEEAKEAKKLTGLMINDQIIEKEILSKVDDNLEFNVSMVFSLYHI